MKAFVLDKYSKQAALRCIEVSEPKINEDEVLIEIYAAAVNLLDSKIKAGEFKIFLPYNLPLIMGHDLAGVVVKVGARVQKFKQGDEVYSRPADQHIGTFAQFIAVNVKDVALKPKNISMEEAASLPLVALTAWQALVEKANVQPGQKVFIQAGSGGVGTIAIQLAKYLGATVATTTSTANIEFVKSLGADLVIDYKKEDFGTILKEYDVVLNSQDAKTLEKSAKILKQGGKLISISGPPDLEFAKDINLPWFLKIIMSLLSFGIKRKAKRLKISYSFLFMQASGSQLEKISQLIEADIIRPLIDTVFQFDKTNEALAYVEAGRAKGKVVIKVK